jgi:hypothetical protein
MRLFHSRLAALPNIAKFQVATGKTLGQLVAQAPRDTETKLAMHQSLARAVQDAYLDDARALDAAFFAPATPMEEALQDAVDQAIPSEQSIAAQDHLSPAAIRMVEVWAGLLSAMASKSGGALRETLKADPAAAKTAGPGGGKKAGKKAGAKRGGGNKAGPHKGGPKKAGPNKGGANKAGAKKTGPNMAGNKKKPGQKPETAFNEDDLFDLI